MATHRFELGLSMVVGGNFSTIVQHWSITDPVGAPNAFQLARDLCKTFGTENPVTEFFGIPTILSSDSFISSIRARQLSPTGGQQFAEVFSPDAWPGTQAANVDSASVAACVIWLTNGGAGINGRTFFPGVPQEVLLQGRFQNAFKDLVTDLGNNLIAGAASDAGYGDWDFVLQTGTSPSFTYHNIVHGYLSPTPGTQRRRLIPL